MLLHFKSILKQNDLIRHESISKDILWRKRMQQKMLDIMKTASPGLRTARPKKQIFLSSFAKQSSA